MNNPNDPQSGENSSPPSSGRGGDGGAGSGNAVEFSSERAYNLIRLELLEEVKGELFNWVKKKLSWIVVILLLLGFGGIHFIIQQLVSSSVESRITDELALVEKQVEGATLATVHANVAAQRANEATEKAVNKANDYIDTVEKLSAKAEQVNTQFAAVRLRFDQESLHSRERAEQDKKELQDQITQLSSLVGKLAATSRETQTAFEEYKKVISKRVEESELKAKQFAENSQYQVAIYYKEETAELSRRAVALLGNKGYKASLIPELIITKVETGDVPHENIIFFRRSWKAKAEEIKKTLLSSLPQIGNLTTEEIAPLGAVEKLLAFGGKPVSFGSVRAAFGKSPQPEENSFLIYLVKKKAD